MRIDEKSSSPSVAFGGLGNALAILSVSLMREPPDSSPGAREHPQITGHHTPEVPMKE